MEQLNQFYSFLMNGKSTYGGSNKGSFEIAYRPLYFVQFLFKDVSSPKFLQDNQFAIEDLGFLAQDIDLPNFELDSDDDVTVKNFAGVYKAPGNGDIIPESNNFVIQFLDTEHSCFEYFFLPWMKEIREIKSQRRSIYPMLRAQVKVFLFKNTIQNPDDVLSATENDIKMTYILDGVYPKRIDSPTLSYGTNNTLIRSVGFEFNNVDVDT